MLLLSKINNSIILKSPLDRQYTFSCLRLAFYITRRFFTFSTEAQYSVEPKVHSIVRFLTFPFKYHASIFVLVFKIVSCCFKQVLYTYIIYI